MLCSLDFVAFHFIAFYCILLHCLSFHFMAFHCIALRNIREACNHCKPCISFHCIALRTLEKLALRSLTWSLQSPLSQSSFSPELITWADQSSSPDRHTYLQKVELATFLGIFAQMDCVAFSSRHNRVPPIKNNLQFDSHQNCPNQYLHSAITLPKS